jgi:hypothetical protein
MSRYLALHIVGVFGREAMLNRKTGRILFRRAAAPAAALGILFGPPAALAGDAAPAALTGERSLQALRQANMQGAALFHLQAPGPDFAPQMRSALARDYAGMDQGIRLGLANIERDLPYLGGYFSGKNRQQLAAFVATYRAKIVAAPDPAEQQVRLAEVMAFAALTAYRQRQNAASPANAFQRQQMDSLRYRQLQGAMRSYSPTCNPTRADAAASFQNCHP